MILYAIASRDADTAASQAKKYNFQKSYGSYQALLDDPEVDFVYISTPNGLHYEWASKALKGESNPSHPTRIDIPSIVLILTCIL